MDIRTKISTDLDIPPELIDEALEFSRIIVKKFYIKKRNGGSRAIYQPSSKLKTIQYWLIVNVFNNLPVHESSAAYIKNKSILWNAKQHRNNKYFLKIDFKNFFPSIKWCDLQPIVRNWHETEMPVWELSDETEKLIRLSCFYKKDLLPIGYPSSPIISNIVMFAVDDKINNLLSDRGKYGNVIFTRYADDMVFSTNKKEVCKEIFNDIKSLIYTIDSPKLSLNYAKTRMGSSTSGSASVTGLKICSEGHITIHKKQKDHIRLLLTLYRKTTLKKEEEVSLLGHLAYVRYVAPQFYTKLQQKYFREIDRLKSNDSTDIF